MIERYPKYAICVLLVAASAGWTDVVVAELMGTLTP